MESYIATIIPFAGNYAPVYFALAKGQLLPLNQYQVLQAVIGNLYGGDGSTTIGLPNLCGRTPIGSGTLANTTLSFNVAQTKGAAEVVLNLTQLPMHAHGATFVPVVSSVNVPVAPVNGTGSLTASVAVPVSTANSTTTAVANHTDLTLAGITVGTVKGPYVTTAPTANTTLAPFNAPVKASSDYKPAIPAQNITIPGVVTNGSVNVGVAGNSGGVGLYQPSLVISFLFCLQGLYPSRAD